MKPPLIGIHCKYTNGSFLADCNCTISYLRIIIRLEIWLPQWYVGRRGQLVRSLEYLGRTKVYRKKIMSGQKQKT